MALKTFTRPKTNMENILTCIDQDYWRKILAEIIHLKESEGWIQDDLLEVGLACFGANESPPTLTIYNIGHLT